EVNLKGIFTLIKDWAQESQQQLLEGIARRAEEGGELVAIEKGGHSIAEIAQKNGTPAPSDFNISFIPIYGSVKITFIPVEPDIYWKKGKITVDTKDNKPIREYTPGYVESYMLQRESILIEFTGLDLDLRL